MQDENGSNVEASVQRNLNPFQFSVTFLYPLKTSENQRFTDVFRGFINVTLD